MPQKALPPGYVLGTTSGAHELLSLKMPICKTSLWNRSLHLNEIPDFQTGSAVACCPSALLRTLSAKWIVLNWTIYRWMQPSSMMPFMQVTGRLQKRWTLHLPCNIRHATRLSWLLAEIQPWHFASDGTSSVLVRACCHLFCHWAPVKAVCLHHLDNCPLDTYKHWGNPLPV